MIMMDLIRDGHGISHQRLPCWIHAAHSLKAPIILYICNYIFKFLMVLARLTQKPRNDTWQSDSPFMLFQD